MGVTGPNAAEGTLAVARVGPRALAVVVLGALASPRPISDSLLRPRRRGPGAAVTLGVPAHPELRVLALERLEVDPS